MSIDKTLRSKKGMSRTRNVLTRAERILRLRDEDRFLAGQSPLGLPKVRVTRVVTGKKTKKVKEEADDAGSKKKK